MATYAIVKTGGKQYKVAVGDLVKVEKIEGAPGTAVTLSPVLVVDGANLTTDADKLAKISVTGEVVEQTKGPKVVSYVKRRRKHSSQRKRGHRQLLTRVRITAIQGPGAAAAATAAATIEADAGLAEPVAAN